MTIEQVSDIIWAHTRKHKRPPTGKQLSNLTEGELSIRQANQAVMTWQKKHIKKLNVIDGKVYDQDGNTVWYQQSRGGMMPAAYYPDTGIGQFISR